MHYFAGTCSPEDFSQLRSVLTIIPCFYLFYIYLSKRLIVVCNFAAFIGRFFPGKTTYIFVLKETNNKVPHTPDNFNFLKQECNNF